MPEAPKKMPGTVQARAVIPLATGRIVDLQDKLIEWGEEAGEHWRVNRAGDDLHVTRHYSAATLDNGTLSAVAYLTAELDRALSEVSDFRWFNVVKVTARLLESRDEPVPEEEEDDG